MDNKTQFSNFSITALFATVFALLVVTVGAFTRLTDAGLGCPDWPGCYGSILVPNKIDTAIYSTPLEAVKAWTEMAHRYIATILGFSIIILFLWAQKKKNILPKSTTVIATLLLLLVIAQGMLGMWTVTMKLYPIVVTAHLLGGFTTFTLLWLMFFTSNRFIISKLIISNRLKIFAFISMLVLILQIALGGWTSANYAALICPDFPYCQGYLLPPLDFNNAFNLFPSLGANYFGGLLDNTARVTIHMSHRIMAIITAGLITSLAIILLVKKVKGILFNFTLASIFLLICQITLGILNIMFLLPLPVAVSHNGIAALLLATIAAINWILWSSPGESAHG